MIFPDDEESTKIEGAHRLTDNAAAMTQEICEVFSTFLLFSVVELVVVRWVFRVGFLCQPCFDAMSTHIWPLAKNALIITLV